MNFDFLENLRVLRNLYDNCINAEKLAMSMPVQSMFTSRKCAELLAKYIYLTAHNQCMEQMDFYSILKDEIFIDFINDKNVMKAFHYIRKNGNLAVHGDENITVDDAIDTLADLHYVTGETACLLGLIDDYPYFNEQIDSFLDAKYIDIIDIEEKAQEMFAEYVEKYNAQFERDCKYDSRLEYLIDEFETESAWVNINPGNVDLNERLVFDGKPKTINSVKAIQAHFGGIALNVIKSRNGTLLGELSDRELYFDGKLTIKGKNAYTTEDLDEFIKGVLYDIPNAEGFEIISNYSGPSVSPWFNVNKSSRLSPSDIETEFYDELEEVGRKEDISYVGYEFLYNHEEACLRSYKNGEWEEIKPKYSNEILDRDDFSWYTWEMSLSIDFDVAKYPDVLEKMHEATKKHLDPIELDIQEKMWEEDPGLLMLGAQWCPKCMREIQTYLDTLNSIIAPIKNECSCGAEGHWYSTRGPFGYATLVSDEKGFKVLVATL